MIQADIPFLECLVMPGQSAVGRFPWCSFFFVLPRHCVLLNAARIFGSMLWHSIDSRFLGFEQRHTRITGRHLYVTIMVHVVISVTCMVCDH